MTYEVVKKERGVNGSTNETFTTLDKFLKKYPLDRASFGVLDFLQLKGDSVSVDYSPYITLEITLK